MDQSFQELESAVLSPEQCLALIAMTRSYVENASETQANQEAVKPAERLPETDPHLKAKLDQFRAQEAFQAQADGIKETFASLVVSGCLAKVYDGRVEPGGHVAYTARMLQETGATKDPLERMMVEQLVWAHHRLGFLHLRAAVERDLDRIAIFNTAAARLMKEFRQAAMALQQYRTPTAKLNIAVEQPVPAEVPVVNGHKVVLPAEKILGPNWYPRPMGTANARKTDWKCIHCNPSWPAAS